MISMTNEVGAFKRTTEQVSLLADKKKNQINAFRRFFTCSNFCKRWKWRHRLSRFFQLRVKPLATNW